MLGFFFLVSATPLCTQTLNISDTPYIYSRSVSSGEVICLNSTQSYLAVIFNHWDSCSVYTHRYTRDDAVTDGPYTSASEYWGFDFGSHTSAALDIAVLSSTTLSFGAVNFYAKSHVRVISNHPDDRFDLSSRSADSLLVAHNQHVQYFNAAPGPRRYEVDMSTGAGDWVTFWHSTEKSANFTGRQTFTRRSTDSEPEVVKWQSDSEDLSEFLEIEVVSSEFETKKYVRLVTNGNRYTPIKWFAMTEVPLWIIGVVAGAFVVLLTIAVVLVVIVRRRRRLASCDRTEGTVAP